MSGRLVDRREERFTAYGYWTQGPHHGEPVPLGHGETKEVALAVARSRGATEIHFVVRRLREYPFTHLERILP